MSPRLRAQLSAFERGVLWPFRLVGLTGADGLVSFSKCVTASIVVSYFVRRPVPLGIAIVCIASSYGLKAFLAFLSSRAVTVSSAPSPIATPEGV